MELRGFQEKLFKNRYARKARNKKEHLKVGAEVVVLTKDGKYPVRELGFIEGWSTDQQYIEVRLTTGELFTQHISNIDILLEHEWRDAADRVAEKIAEVEVKYGTGLGNWHYARGHFVHALKELHLIPSGRILAGAGDDSNVTLFNCYVIGITPPEGQEHFGRDSRQAIFHTMGRISEIMARGGGVGTCLSVLRPKDAPLSQTKGRSAGAVNTGNMFSSLTGWVEQANRRGAQMLTLADWHPDVFYTNDPNDPLYTEDFIGAKMKQGFMEGNNSSILISDAFMEAVKENKDWDLKFPDTSHPAYNKEWDGNIRVWEEKGYPVIVYRRVKARDMWQKIMYCNWASAEPGIIFVDRYNQMHNGWYLGTIMATNPCGEQGLLENSTCNLSAINLSRMVKQVGEDENGALYEINWDLLKHTTKIGVRFLDNVLDTSYYFSEEMKQQQLGERRVGLGVLGLHDMLIALRVKYGSPESIQIIEEVFKTIRDEAYRASIELAKERGTFPFFDAEKYLQSGFVKTLPQDIQEDIKKYGIRNLTLLTVAPTGTTGTMTPSIFDPEGSVSTGCEPHFAMKYNRLSRIGSTTQYAGIAKAWLDKHPDRELPDYFVGAMDLTPEEHVNVQSAIQKYVDSSISKTVNVPHDCTVEQVSKLYMLLYEKGCKGGTIYRDGSRYEQILTIDPEDREPKQEEKKPRGRYEDWTCPNCGSESFTLVENCPMCDECKTQACSL